MTYKILEIVENDTKVEFTFDDYTTSIQTIANLPVTDDEALRIALKNYAEAYLRGLKSVEVEPTITVGEELSLDATLEPTPEPVGGENNLDILITDQE